MIAEHGDADSAVAVPDRVAMLDFAIELKLAEIALQHLAIGDFGEVEQPGPHRPRPPIPFDRRTRTIAPGVGGIIEAAGIDERPVDEIGARIMRVAVGIEHIADPELAERHHHPVGRPPGGELIERRGRIVARATEIDRLAEEQPLQPEIGIALANLIRLRTGETRDAQRVGQAKALVHFRIDPHLAALPRAHPGIERRVDRFLDLVRRQAVLPRIRRAKARRALRGEGELAVDGENVGQRWGRGRGDRLRSWCGLRHRRCRNASQKSQEVDAHRRLRIHAPAPVRPNGVRTPIRHRKRTICLLTMSRQPPGFGFGGATSPRPLIARAHRS
ncbi:hypothetical protein D9M73_122260 [compost metagenome]